jgi:hypothetical protein
MTAEELLKAAQGWTRPGCRTRTRYEKLDPTIEHLLDADWQPKEIVEQLVRHGAHPRDKAPALKDHVCRLYRRRKAEA